ncbi:MAG TPA: HIT family protein [Actinomycetota bacterium]|nr:HIT family protein [Actinomycetota bacterium]
MSPSDCVFCDIVAGHKPAEVVAETERALAFMDINPATDGHSLVISKAHANDIWDLEADDGAAVWSLTLEVADAIRAALRPDGLTLFQANAKAGWQDVFHFHLHLVPRWVDDGLVKPWRSGTSRRAGIEAAAARIRASASA